MITNIVIPMPMPMTGGGSIEGGAAPAIISILGAFFILGLVAYIIGYLYEGIKYGDWSLKSDGTDMKDIGGFFMIVSVSAAFLALVACFIYSLLGQ